ncbi:Regulator of chromosome condensation-like protein [Dinothrombium tinctorium]|uniref:Regulator of chromosome condensation-like protein n=1 Tax=Dinothrombium tinctorium TaxID=1965070 RepID=A0A443R691_9ACAR|nr:Regulator of chromosome condensation-like protein [Dinothrombium tinctorium]
MNKAKEEKPALVRRTLRNRGKREDDGEVIVETRHETAKNTKRSSGSKKQTVSQRDENIEKELDSRSTMLTRSSSRRGIVDKNMNSPFLQPIIEEEKPKKQARQTKTRRKLIDGENAESRKSPELVENPKTIDLPTRPRRGRSLNVPSNDAAAVIESSDIRTRQKIVKNEKTTKNVNDENKIELNSPSKSTIRTRSASGISRDDEPEAPKETGIKSKRGRKIVEESEGKEIHESEPTTRQRRGRKTRDEESAEITTKAPSRLRSPAKTFSVVDLKESVAAGTRRQSKTRKMNMETAETKEKDNEPKLNKRTTRMKQASGVQIFIPINKEESENEQKKDGQPIEEKTGEIKSKQEEKIDLDDQKEGKDQEESNIPKRRGRRPKSEIPKQADEINKKKGRPKKTQETEPEDHVDSAEENADIDDKKVSETANLLQETGVDSKNEKQESEADAASAQTLDRQKPYAAKADLESVAYVIENVVDKVATEIEFEESFFNQTTVSHITESETESNTIDQDKKSKYQDSQNIEDQAIHEDIEESKDAEEESFRLSCLDSSVSIMDEKTSHDDTIEFLTSKPKQSKRALEEEDVPSKKIRVKDLEITKIPSLRGQLMTFGEDSCGELGLSSIGITKNKPILIDSIKDPVASVVAGAMHTVCLTTDGHIYTFGCNDEYALGRDTSNPPESEAKPVRVPLPVTVVKVTAGDSHTAALTNLGCVYYMGNFRDQNGRIGLTPVSVDSVLEPTPIAFDITFVDIASGCNHMLLLSEKGEVYTIGVGDQGQLGRLPESECKFEKSKAENFLKPHKIIVDKTEVFDKVWAGSYTSFARTTSGKIYVWGLNNFCQLGLRSSSAETSSFEYFPRVLPSFTRSQAKVKEICGGSHHSLALDADGCVYSCGRYEYGRLGHGETNTDEESFKWINTLRDTVVAIACGPVCSFAVTEGGCLYAWGMESVNLGVGGEQDRFSPTLVTAKSLRNRQVLSVTAGSQHTAIIVTFGEGDSNGK